MTVAVKICGIVREADLLAALDAGADMVGLNFVPTSPRRVSAEQARRLASLARGRAEVIGVVADLELSQLAELRALGLDALQLHGQESPEQLRQLSVSDFKAVRIATQDDVERAYAYPAEQRLLVDAKVPGTLGGSGHAFDWHLVERLSRERRLIVAGGLTAFNVAQCVSALRPYGVDTASGVESAPAVKDAAKMRQFVAAARGPSARAN